MMAKKKRKSKLNWTRIIYLSIVIIVLSGTVKAWDLYQKVMRTNVVLTTDKSDYFYIPSGASFEKVCEELRNAGFVRNINSFIWVAEKKNYPSHIYPGKYKIKDGMNNNELVNLLRSGDQEAVNVRFQNVRNLKELAGKVAENIEADSTEILDLLKDESFVVKYGFNRNQVISMFIPNTYEFYWNTSAEEFFKSLEAHNRDIIDPKANRYFFVDSPVKLSIKNAPELLKAFPSLLN